MRGAARFRRDRFRPCARPRSRQGEARGAVRCAVAGAGLSRPPRAAGARTAAGAAGCPTRAVARADRGHQGRFLHHGARRGMAMTAIARGFADPVRDAQAVFRAVMNAMARPGTVQALHGVAAPAPLSPSAAAVGLALLDYETPVWLDPALASADVMDWLRFHTGSAVTTDPGRAAFAFTTGESLPDFATFAEGTPDYPDRSTTLVVTVAGFAGGPKL